jgi:tRNA modification GTPase
MPSCEVTLLTPPTTGAIAVLRLRGAGAWAKLQSLFRRPGGTLLPAEPVLHRFWYGTLGEGDGVGDEVILAVKQLDPAEYEVHCHGGQQVVRWLIQQLDAQQVPFFASNRAMELLSFAPTQRTANILLEQATGNTRASQDAERNRALAKLGEHLVKPWNVALAGPPNVGKSSLMNALAGFQRSVVAPVAGTTRDVVSFTTAFDGWPVTLSDTAGLRDSSDELEEAGIARANKAMDSADLVLWLEDPTELEVPPPATLPNVLRVANKFDLAKTSWATDIAVSATTKQNLPELMALIVNRLVTVVPEPGETVPL